MLLRMSYWYKKNQKPKENNKGLRQKVKGLQGKLFMKKPRQSLNVQSKQTSKNLEVLIQALEAVH